jgi:hypothetical protein
MILARFICASHGRIHRPLYPVSHTNDPEKDYFQDGAVIGDIDCNRVRDEVLQWLNIWNITGDHGTLGTEICSDLWVVLKIVWACVESRVIDKELVDRSRSSLFSTSELRHMLLQKKNILTASSSETSLLKSTEDYSSKYNSLSDWLDTNKKDSMSENKSTILMKSSTNSNVDQRPMSAAETGDRISNLTTDSDNEKICHLDNGTWWLQS